MTYTHIHPSLSSRTTNQSVVSTDSRSAVINSEFLFWQMEFWYTYTREYKRCDTCTSVPARHVHVAPVILPSAAGITPLQYTPPSRFDSNLIWNLIKVLLPDDQVPHLCLRSEPLSDQPLSERRHLHYGARRLHVSLSSPVPGQDLWLR